MGDTFLVSDNLEQMFFKEYLYCFAAIYISVIFLSKMLYLSCALLNARLKDANDRN